MSADGKPASRAQQTMHATCVDFNGHGVLIVGKSGMGKSDLALRLIENNNNTSQKATLVSDDQVVLTSSNDQLVASPPNSLEGLLEVRGVGLCRFDFTTRTTIKLLIKLGLDVETERLPDFSTQKQKVAGVQIPYIVLNPFEASACLKVRQALKLLARSNDD